MSRLVDELSERAERFVKSRGKPQTVIDAYQFSWNGDELGITYGEDASGNRWLRVFSTEFMMTFKNGVPQKKHVHYIDCIAKIVKQLREKMLLDDLADGRTPPPESVLEELL